MKVTNKHVIQAHLICRHRYRTHTHTIWHQLQFPNSKPTKAIISLASSLPEELQETSQDQQQQTLAVAPLVNKAPALYHPSMNSLWPRPVLSCLAVQSEMAVIVYSSPLSLPSRTKVQIIPCALVCMYTVWRGWASWANSRHTHHVQYSCSDSTAGLPTQYTSLTCGTPKSQRGLVQSLSTKEMFKNNTGTWPLSVPYTYMKIVGSIDSLKSKTMTGLAGIETSQ